MKDFFRCSRKRGWFLVGLTVGIAAALSVHYYPLHPRVLAVIWAILLTGGSGWFLETRNRQPQLFWGCVVASLGLFAIAVANMASVGFSGLISAVALVSGYVACRNILALSSVDRSQRPLMLYRAGFALVFLCAAIADLL
jgi:hypothetical protein